MKIFITSSSGISPRSSTFRLSNGLDVPVFKIDNSDLKNIDIPNFNKLDRVTKLAVASVLPIKDNLKINESEFTKDLACIVGSARGATSTLESAFLNFHLKGVVPPTTSPLTTAGGIATSISNLWQKPPIAIGTSMACASFMEALVIAESMIKSKRIKRAIVCGAEAVITGFSISQFIALKIYSQESGDFPCKPFNKDNNKNTLVVSEGAASILLESEESIVETKNNPLFELKSIGLTQERNITLTGMSAEGDSFLHSMEIALKSASIFKMPDLIVAHAPGTIAGDTSEYNAIMRLSNKLDNSDELNVFSTKLLYGHSFGASSALTMNFICNENEFLNRKMHYPYKLKDNIALNPLDKLPSLVMINSAGFGGVVGSIIISKVI
jgi:3-oxoacyl-[acyl-carrier-protein] synthase II